MKNVNKKRLLLLYLSGFVLLNSFGCSNSKIENEASQIEGDENQGLDYPLNENSNLENKNSTYESNEEQDNTLSEDNSIKEEIKEFNDESIDEQNDDIDSNIENDINITSEEDLINYIYSLKSDIDNCLNSESLEEFKTSVIKKFIIVVDFVFYDSSIGGYTFDELTDTTKQKILEILYDIDLKIESKFPNYKNSLNEKYNIASSFIKEKYNEITKELLEKLKEELGEDNYNDLMEDKDNAIDNLNEGLDVVEEYGGKVKEKVSSWYQDLKEQY